jgi:glycosyltransferase involved in cell wall biosynthesis
MSSPIISFILPVFRNEGSIKITCLKIEALFHVSVNSFDYEIILVNDGSDDGSWSEILEITAINERVKALSFSRNFGQVPAMIAGARHATGNAAVFMSADLQDPVELIEEMIHEWQNKKSEIVICYRTDREDSIAAKLTSAIFYRFMKIANPKMPEGGFDYVLIDRKPLDVFAAIDERNRFFQGDILWMGFNIKFIPYKRQKRTIGKSQWNFSKKLKYFIDGSLNTSYLPIRFMSTIGISTALLGFVYAFVVAYARFINKVPFKGYAPIVILLLIIGGLIMIMLGIIGEYLWRVYDETRNRPIYVIQNRINLENNAESKIR